MAVQQNKKSPSKRGMHRNTWHIECVVRTVHTALGRGFFVLLDGHDSLLMKAVSGV